MKARKISSVFFKYIISFGVLFLLLLSIFSAIIYNTTKINLSKQAKTDGINNINKVKYLMDYNFSRINDITMQVEFNKNIENSTIYEDHITGMDTMYTLKQFSALMPIVDEVILYFYGNKYIYSNISSYKKDFFGKLKGKDLEYIIEKNNNKNKRKIGGTLDQITNNMGQQFIVISDFFNKSSMHNLGSVTYLIDIDSIHGIINNTISYENSNVLIFSQNKMIYSFKDCTKEVIQNINTQIQNKNQIQDINIDGQKNILFLSKSSIGDFQYVSYISYDEIMKPVKNMKNKYIVLVTVFFIIGIIIVYLLAEFNYRPIKDLSVELEKIYPDYYKEKGEFDNINDALNFFHNKNSILDNEIRENSKILERYFYYQLLKGVNKNEYCLLNEKENEKFNYRVMIFKLERIDHITDKKLIIEEIIKNLMKNEIIYIESIMEINNIICIMRYEEFDRTVLIQKINQSINNFVGKSDEGVTISIGNEYKGYKHICKSFADAIIALEYRNINMKKEIIFYDELKQNNTFISIPNVYLERMKINIGSGDRIKLEETFNSIKSYLSNNKLSARNSGAICINLINIILNTLDGEKREFISKNAVMPNIIELTEVDTQDKTFIILDKIYRSLINLIEVYSNKDNTQENEKEKLALSIMKYIQQNYYNCNLSIQDIADHNNIKLPNLTKYFKKETGQTIIEYLIKIRMNKAKNYLIGSNDNINNISNKVGYQNASSFIRQFKNTVGLTPGEYRKKYKKM